MTQTSPTPDSGFKERIAIFPGSFNPFTIGHASIVSRALPLFDKIVIAIGINPAKDTQENISRRLDNLRRLYAGSPQITVRSYSGLTVDLARSLGARFILRGIRSVKDFEYERDMADINRRLSGIETILLYTLPEHAAISSSVVRELTALGTDTTQFLP